MKAFIVPKGTTIVAIRHKGYDAQKGGYSFSHVITKAKKENVFFLEDMIIDPLGKHDDNSEENAGVAAVSMMMPLGYDQCYAFRRMDLDTGKRMNWTLMVRASEVQVG